MNAREEARKLLHSMSSSGLSLNLDGDSIIVTGDRSGLDFFMEAVRANKPELLVLLQERDESAGRLMDMVKQHIRDGAERPCDFLDPPTSGLYRRAMRRTLQRPFALSRDEFIDRAQADGASLLVAVRLIDQGVKMNDACRTMVEQAMETFMRAEEYGLK